MRKPLALLVVALCVAAFSGSVLSKSKAAGSLAPKGFVQGEMTPGTRCTRFSLKGLPKALKKVAPDTRCARLYSGKIKGRFLPNVPPKVGLYPLAVDMVLSGKGATPTCCASENNQKVKLRTFASDRDGDSMLYTFSVTGGKVVGADQRAPEEVVWDLGGATPGTYIATVEVDDGCGCVSFSSATVTVAP